MTVLFGCKQRPLLDGPTPLNLTLSNLLKDQIEKEFELILIMEHYDISLAVMVLKLCWDIDEAIYLKVNAQARPQGNAWNQNKLQGELGICGLSNTQ